MATELWCTKIVHSNVEHQYWIDRTVSMSDMFKKNCPADWHPVEYKNMTSRRMWHSIWYKSGNKVGNKLLFPKINVDWDGMIYYNPNSRILEWGGWSIHGLRDTKITQFYNNMSGKSKLNNTINNRSKTHLQNVLRNFTNQGKGKSEMLKHFDKHSYWYWDSYEAPFTDKQLFGTYNPSTQDIITYV